jgi:hypothetical protein
MNILDVCCFNMHLLRFLWCYLDEYVRCLLFQHASSNISMVPDEYFRCLWHRPKVVAVLLRDVRAGGVAGVSEVERELGSILRNHFGSTLFTDTKTYKSLICKFKHVGSALLLRVVRAKNCAYCCKYIFI